MFASMRYINTISNNKSQIICLLLLVSHFSISVSFVRSFFLYSFLYTLYSRSVTIPANRTFIHNNVRLNKMKGNKWKWTLWTNIAEKYQDRLSFYLFLYEFYVVVVIFFFLLFILFVVIFVEYCSVYRWFVYLYCCQSNYFSWFNQEKEPNIW